MSNMPFVSKLKPDALKYFNFILNKNKPKKSSLILLWSICIVAMNSFLSYSIFNNQTETNLVKNLIYFNFYYSLFMFFVISIASLITVFGILLISKNKEKLLIWTKNVSIYKDSFIFNCLKYVNLLVGFVYLAFLATTNHTYIFLFACFFQIFCFISLLIFKQLITYQLNLLTTEDVDKFIASDVENS